MQKWQTSAIEGVKVEKSKHIHLEIGGTQATSLHFNVGSKDTADSIVKKLESSKALAIRASSHSPVPRTSPPPGSPAPPALSINVGTTQKTKRNGATVHFAPSPAVIPSPTTPVGDMEAEDEDDAALQGEPGSALYDFVADGENELSVKEGDQLFILDKVSDEWWKCRNVHGAEGDVPASYIEVRSLALKLLAGSQRKCQTAGGLEVNSGPLLNEDEDENDNAALQERAAREEAERAAAESEAAAAKARELEEREKDRRKQEADRKAKVAAAAKAEKERRDQEVREREERMAQEREAARKREAEVAK